MSKFNYQTAAIKILREKKYYGGTNTAIFGNSTALIKAAANYIQDSEPGAIFGFTNRYRLAVAIVQLYCRELGFNPGKIDGYAGPQTSYAVAEMQGKVDYFRDDPPKAASPFPSESGVPAFYGDRGENQVMVDVPYPLFLAWNNDEVVKRISLHQKCADSASKAMDSILKEYGNVKIRELGIDQFGGSLNVRLKRGSKTQWSMHSWGIAIDWFPQKNQLRWGSDKALFARDEYRDFWNIWEAEGWTSYGRARNFDWMHVQAASI